jgi:hypothetical protein
MVNNDDHGEASILSAYNPDYAMGKKCGARGGGVACFCFCGCCILKVMWRQMFLAPGSAEALSFCSSQIWLLLRTSLQGRALRTACATSQFHSNAFNLNFD